MGELLGVERVSVFQFSIGDARRKDHAWREQRLRRFNSLLEMLLRLAQALSLRRLASVSILYWRCSNTTTQM